MTSLPRWTAGFVRALILVAAVCLFAPRLPGQGSPPSLGEALNAPELSWQTGGEASWFVQTNVSADGLSAAQSGAVGSGETSWLSTTVEGPGRLEFDWKLLTPSNYSSMQFRVDEWGFLALCEQNADWERVSYYSLQAGQHKLTWTYLCLSNEEKDQAKGWLDRVTFIQGGVPPRIIMEPADRTTTTEGAVEFRVEVEGTEPFHYQWFHEGAELQAGSSPVLCLSGVTSEDAGTYRVSVSNAYGSTMSTPAQLAVIPAFPLDLALGTNGWQWLNDCFQDAWFGQTNMTFEGRPAAQSGAGRVRAATLRPVGVVGPGTLSFAWRLNAESFQDSLILRFGSNREIYCDPVVSDWQRRTVYLGSGEQWLSWSHWNGSTSSLAGAWLADVHWLAGGTAPFITEEPQDAFRLEGSLARLRVKADGTPALHYQWRRQGEPVAGATGEMLELLGLKQSDAGAYDVAVWNEYGTNVSRAAKLTVGPAPAEPRLVFSGVPVWNTCGELLEGKVYHLDPKEHLVAVYIEVYGTWWSKPYWGSECIEIQDDGTWTTRVCTGGSDPVATTFAAFVLRKPCDVASGHPPSLGGQAELPRELFDRAVTWATVERSLPHLAFSGYDWLVKSGRWGPDNNYFSHLPQNVWVDGQGRLHLKLTRSQGVWRCAEVILTQSLGYGTYRFYIDSPVSDPPPNVVTGLFTWSNFPDFSHREIDIEFSRWREGPDAPDGQFVVQPWTPPGHRERFTLKDALSSVHSLTWEPNQIWFRSLAGGDPDTDDPGDSMAEWRFDHPDEVPRPGDENPRINLWLIGGAPPGDGNEFELIVRRFEHVPHLSPLPESLSKKTLQLLVSGVPGTSYVIEAASEVTFANPSLWREVTLADRQAIVDGGRFSDQTARFLRLRFVLP